jgi:hypothetical protein
MCSRVCWDVMYGVMGCAVGLWDVQYGVLGCAVWCDWMFYRV